MTRTLKTTFIAGLASLVGLCAITPALAQDAPSGVLDLRLVADATPSPTAQLVFVDQKSKSQSAAKITAWQLTLFAVPRPADGGKKVAGVWNRMTVDCVGKTIQGGAGVVLSDSLDVLMKGDSGEPSRPVRPNSVDSRVSDLLCQDKDPFPTNPTIPSVALARSVALSKAPK